MLKELRLINIVLVESASISFGPGFNVLSGESGSGKSAIMNALNLIAGERADQTLIRRGSEKGSVEAIFEIEENQQLIELLDRSGIDHEKGSELFIRREISTTGKSRAFINHQAAQLTLLKRVADHLFEIVGQHANQKLFSLDYHRQVLDLYGEMQSSIADFESCWEKEISVQNCLEQLISSEAQRLRDIEVLRMEIEELEQANLKNGEEEELFEEYSQLSNADELAQKAEDLTRMLFGEKTAVLAHLNRHKNTLEQLILLAPSLAETASTYHNAILELNEVGHTLRNFESRIEHNPQRTEELNVRLELITRLKRKYGNTITDIHSYLKKSKDKLSKLENSDAQIDELQEQLKTLKEKSDKLSGILTQRRKKTAVKFQSDMTSHLRVLNMPKVEFYVDITSQKRNHFGDDKIEFFIVPNVGEHRLSIRECASGGELSRVMLALQALLAGKEKTPTLVFDEVDANIGGETASVVGEKLKEIGNQHQLLCITHFPQVAKQADHHLRISKKEVEGRTVTLVDLLNASTREHELARMLGEKA